MGMDDFNDVDEVIMEDAPAHMPSGSVFRRHAIVCLAVCTFGGLIFGYNTGLSPLSPFSLCHSLSRCVPAEAARSDLTPALETASIAGALPLLVDDFYGKLTPAKQGVLTCSILLGALIGSTFGASLLVVPPSPSLFLSSFFFSKGPHSHRVSSRLRHRLGHWQTQDTPHHRCVTLSSRCRSSQTHKKKKKKKGLTTVVGAVGTAATPYLWVMILFREILGLGVGIASVVCGTFAAEYSPPKARGVITASFQV